MCKASALSLCYCSSPPRWYFSLWGSWLFGPLLYDSHHKWISRAPLWWQIIISIFPAIATPIFFSVRPGPHTYKSSVLHWPTSKELSSFSCNNLFSSQREPVHRLCFANCHGRGWGGTERVLGTPVNQSLLCVFPSKEWKMRPSLSPNLCTNASWTSHLSIYLVFGPHCDQGTPESGAGLENTFC